LLFFYELFQGLNEAVPVGLVVVVGDVGDQDVAVYLRVFFEEFPKHAAFDVEFAFLAVVVDLSFIHHAFIALRD